MPTSADEADFEMTMAPAQKGPTDVDHVAEWEEDVVPPVQREHVDVSPQLDHLGADEKQTLSHVLTEFPDVFSQQGEIGRFKGEPSCEFQIELSGEPRRAKQYSVPVALQPELEKQIKSMLEQDVIRPCSSPHASPVLLVPKKTEPGEPPRYRFVTDFRELNKVTVKDRHPLPRIESLLAELGPRAKYYVQCARSERCLLAAPCERV